MENVKKVYVLICSILVFSTTTVFAQVDVNTVITGVVVDINGAPLDGVEISQKKEATKTKPDGKFSWQPLQNSKRKVQLSFKKLGYKTKIITVKLKKNKPLVIELVSNGDSLAPYKISKVNIEEEARSIINDKWGQEFKHATCPKQFLNNIIELKPGDDIQDAINKANSAGGGVVFLTAGKYTVSKSLALKSKVTISGAGRLKTIVKYDGDSDFIGKGKGKLTDIVFKDITF
ncbi:carboxypeptidase-like regulatory domain-containing protein [Polaribacter sp.]|nr:carboxypeptidase-like regulatory domain-containing protein [Polaribacter sp.]